MSALSLVNFTPRTKKILWSAFGISVLANILALTSSIFMLHLYDRVLPSQSLPTLIFLLGLALFLLVVMGLLDVFRGRLMSIFADDLDRHLRGRVFAGAFNRALSSGGGTTNGQFAGELDNVRAFVGTGVQILFDLLWAPFFLIALFIFNVWLGLIAVICMLISFGIAYSNEIATRTRYQSAQQYVSQAAEQATDLFRSADAVRAMGFYDMALGRWLQTMRAAGKQQQIAASEAAIAMSGVKTVRYSVQLIVMSAAAVLVIKGVISSGLMFAASTLVMRALQPVDQAVGAWRQFSTARSAWKNLGKAFEEAPNEGEKTRLPPPIGNISVENCTVAAPGTNTVILGGVNMRIGAGEFIAVVGPSGGGKSTLVRIIANAWRPNAGKVRMDGADYDQWPSDQLGPAIGFLPQTIQLIRGTVAENIARLHSDCDEDVIEASKLAGAHDMIMALPQGYNTQIGPSGSRLSGGQRQRIGLARALFRKPKVIILDEPETGLDTVGQRALTDMLQKLRTEGATVIVVSHSPQLVRNFDKVAVVQEGRLTKFDAASAVLNEILPIAAAPKAPVKPNADKPAPEKAS
jgi:PrtD family type I secretion system ABC transporter